jgi:hypothetical protein
VCRRWIQTHHATHQHFMFTPPRLTRLTFKPIVGHVSRGSPMDSTFNRVVFPLQQGNAYNRLNRGAPSVGGQRLGTCWGGRLACEKARANGDRGAAGNRHPPHPRRPCQPRTHTRGGARAGGHADAKMHTRFANAWGGWTGDAEQAECPTAAAYLFSKPTRTTSISLA